MWGLDWPSWRRLIVKRSHGYLPDSATSNAQNTREPARDRHLQYGVQAGPPHVAQPTARGAARGRKGKVLYSEIVTSLYT